MNQFVAVAILAIPLCAQDGSVSSTDLSNHRAASCSITHSDQNPVQGISVADVSFPGPLALPQAEQEQITGSIKGVTRGPEDAVLDEALEIARRGWQDQGYFKVQVHGDSKTLTSNAIVQRVALTIRADEGRQYTLSEIRFKGNQAIVNKHVLRSLFPLANGDVFSRGKIAAGLGNLRKAYGEYGFANYTGVPETEFDENAATATLTVDIDEGKQFFIIGIEILGVDDATKEQLLKDTYIKVGEVYNSRLVEMFEQQHASTFPKCECRDTEQKRLDESRGLAVLTFDARPCPPSE